MPRLGSKKTRTGCMKCRQRRIKCDEKRPCSACKKHDLECSLVSHDTPSPSVHVPGHLAPIACKTPTISPRDVSQTSSGSQSDTDSQEIAWVTDLELMLHYTTEAYLTLPRISEFAHIWQKLAPGFAISHQYLLRLILAFSALHLAYLEPNKQQKYSLVATQHQSLGLQQFRVALTQISADDCHVLFMAASFVIKVHLATLATRIAAGDPSGTAVEDMVEMFVLVKGMSAVLNTWEHIIHGGCLNPMFAHTPVAGPRPFWNEISDKLQHLRATLPKRETDPVIAEILETETLTLSNTFKHAIDTASAPELRILVTWPVYASDTYVRLLRAGCPGALIILTFYCAIVHETESNTWYSRGLGSRIVQQIQARLEPEWVDLIQWPLERTRASAVASHSLHS
ncbi:hypothetical protein GGR51DRAFT_549831 [Nemania sp. FL0031]|nr:hypothetical protein GGR51DRAFT_549831 [Nemania sp. FL0031]